ncbi:MAG: Na-translocating system protein MpsC family protein [Pirellulaceae bacterium]
MQKLNSTMAQQVAEAISVFQEQRTGYAPKAVTVVLSADTLVVTLHEALSPAEKALSRTSEGAAQVQEFHRELFRSSVDSLLGEIRRITGVAVGEAAAEVETTTGAVVHAFTTGTMVQVFRLAGKISAGAWNGHEDQSHEMVVQPLHDRTGPNASSS